jgi:hypothetical protein
MISDDEVADMVKYVIAGLNAKDGAVEKYVKYLNMLRKFFEVLARIDNEQVPITWLEQVLPASATGAIKTHVVEMPLNQFIKQMDAYILGSISEKYVLGDNITVFDEDTGQERIIHWIFAPKTYTDVLKNLYKIRETLTMEEEKGYLVKLLEAYK